VSNASQATVLADASDFGTVASELTGSDGTDLQNSNIDDLQFTAGIFGADASAQISQVLLADDISATDFDAGPNGNGETIHHEQITLNDETSFASIAAAEAIATSGDRIDVAEGEYTTGSSGLEPSDLDIETDELVISGANGAPGANRVDSDGDLTDPGLESELRVDIDANDTRDFTLANFAVTHSGSGPAISILNEAGNNDEPRDPRLDAVVVRADATFADGVAFGTRSGSDNITLNDSAIFQTADPDDVDNDQTGVLFQEVNNPIVSSNNLIVGFERQVVDGTSLGVSLADFFANNRFGEDDPDDLAHAAVVVDNAGATPGSLTDVTTIFGSINAADDAAEDGEVIDVFDATYREDFSNSIDTNTTAVVGDDAVRVGADADTVVLNSSGGDVRVESLTLIDNTGLDDSGAAAGNITIDDVTVEPGTGAITLTNTAADANVVVGNVTAEDYTGTGQFLTIGPRDFGQVSVADSQIDLDDITDDSVGGIAINTTNDTVGGVSVTNTTIDATDVEATDTPTGITVDVAGVNGDVDISTNNVINASNGLGIAYRTASGASADGIGDDGELLVENNRVSGGSNLTAMRLEPVQDGDGRTTGSVDGNVLIGTGVGDGTGLVTRGTQGSDLKDLILEDAGGNPVKSNTISGFETLVNSELSRPSTFDVSAAYGDSFGTHVVPDEIDTDGSVEESPIQGNIYGSIQDANDDLDPQNNNNTVDLRITDTDLSIDSLHGNPVPTDYVHADDDEVSFDTNLNNVNVEGPGSGTDAPVVENVNFVIPDGNGNLANHDIRDLPLNGTNGYTAIAVESTSNSQSTFERLAVTTTATGVNVSSQDDDVTVVEIRDSTFDVDGDGIVLADSADDRDGFVVDNVTLAGDNLTEDSDTGLDLSNVDTPGKEELPTELEVRGLDVSNFETQLKLSEELVGLELDGSSGVLDAQAVYEGSVSADGGDIVFANNTFAQAVFVNESFEEPQFTTTVTNLNSVSGVADVVFADTGLSATQERLADNQTIYGSITEADATGVNDFNFDNVTLQAVDSDGTVVPAPSNIEFGVFVEDADGSLVQADTVEIAVNQPVEVDVDTASAVVDVRAASQDLTAPDRLYDEDVVVGAGDTDAADELLVRGPQAGTAATDSLRGPEAIILGTLGDSRDDPTNATTDITVDGLTTVAPHEYSVIEFQTDVDRFDAGGPDRGDFEAGDEFVVNQPVDTSDELSGLDSGLKTDDLNLDTNPLEAPSAPDVATFDDSRDITVNNTAFSATVTEDRVVVSGGDSPGAPIDVERQSLNPTPDELKTSAVGINVSSVGDVTIANSFVGDHTAVDTTGDSVVTSGGASATVVDSTLAPSPVDVSTIEEPTETTNTLLFSSIEGFDVDAATPPTAPVGVNAGADSELTVSASDVTGHPGDGVLVNATEADVVLNESTTVADSGARGVGVASGSGLTIDNAVVANSTDIGVDVRANVDLSITEATIEDGSATGVLLDATLAGAEISQTTIANNTAPDATADGLRLTQFVDAPNVTVRANAFENNDFGIRVANTADKPLDATLNYFGDSKGPAAAGGDSVTETVIYDPFLTEDQTDVTVAEIQSTQDFGHDVVIPADSTVSVGFPAQPNPERDEVDQVFSADTDGALFRFNDTTQQFEIVENFDSAEVNAFDGYVVDNTGDRETALIEYQNDRSPIDTPANAFEFQSGLNFVPPQEAGPVNEVLFPGGDTDSVAQPFTSGTNLYGDTGATQVRDGFTSPTEDGFGANFRSGVGGEIVHPHTAYLVIVNEESNVGLTVTEQIPVPTGPTADNIAGRTGANPANFQLSSASATATPSGNASSANTTDVVVDVTNIGDGEDTQTVNATALTGLNASANQTVTLDADEEQTLEFTLSESGTALEEGEQVRVEIRIEGTDKSVKVTATA
jgi:hypothetical protein